MRQCVQHLNSIAVTISLYHDGNEYDCFMLRKGSLGKVTKNETILSESWTKAIRMCPLTIWNSLTFQTTVSLLPVSQLKKNLERILLNKCGSKKQRNQEKVWSCWRANRARRNMRRKQTLMKTVFLAARVSKKASAMPKNNSQKSCSDSDSEEEKCEPPGKKYSWFFHRVERPVLKPLSYNP